jgi:Sulfotransferase family
VPSPLRTAELHLRTLHRVLPRAGFSRARIGALDGRLVFVVGSPRSGTTFLGNSLGSLPGFVDLGEVASLKAEIPALANAPAEEAAPRIRRILTVTRRMALLGGLRAVEQTPESAFVVASAQRAFPEARFVHAVRDGRDVVCSLLERGWLRAGRGGGDDASLPYGASPRFWVEPERREEFSDASDARRAAWAWRRYVTAVRAVQARVHEVRYERLSTDPAGVAGELAAFLDAPGRPLATALTAAHGTSVGRWERELADEELADVLAESGDLLRELDYLQSV